MLNTNNPTDNVATTYSPTTTVTYTLTSLYKNATYPTTPQQTNQYDLTMGADTATSGFKTDILRPLNSIGSGQSNMFAASLQNRIIYRTVEVHLN